MSDLTVTMRAGVSHGPQVELVRWKSLEAYDRITVVRDAKGAGSPGVSVRHRPGSASHDHPVDELNNASSEILVGREAVP